MRKTLLVIFSTTICVFSIANAGDRNLTPEELEKVGAALKTIGCDTITESEVDDNEFEVEVTCEDGKRYEVDLDMNYKVLRKKLD